MVVFSQVQTTTRTVPLAGTNRKWRAKYIGRYINRNIARMAAYRNLLRRPPYRGPTPGTEATVRVPRHEGARASQRRAPLDQNCRAFQHALSAYH